jgi:hypothetical protein
MLVKQNRAIIYILQKEQGDDVKKNITPYYIDIFGVWILD